MRRIKVLNLGFLEYEKGWLLQKFLTEKCLQNRINGINESYLLFCEHFPVYTIGKAGVSSHFKNSRSPLIPAYRIERGGDVTWHGPGQLVAYPLFDLTVFRKDLHWFIRCVEQTVIMTLKELGVEAERSDVNSGVWVNGNKISAVGINASRWITMHGTSLNINCNLKYFADIVPCGIDPARGGVSKLSDFLNRDITTQEIIPLWKTSFSVVFDSILEYSSVQEMEKVVLEAQTYTDQRLQLI